MDWSHGLVNGLVTWTGHMVWSHGLVTWSGHMVWSHGLVTWSGHTVAVRSPSFVDLDFCLPPSRALISLTDQNSILFYFELK